MKFFYRTALMLLAAASVLPAQNGTRMIGFNAKSMGRGGTSIGRFDSPELMMTNPAGIAFLPSSTLDADLSLMLPAVQFVNTMNDKSGEKNIFPLPALAYVHRYEHSSFTWGAGVFTTGGMGADFSLKHALFVDQSGNAIPQTYHSKLAFMQGGLSAASLVTEKLSVGVSAHVVYSILEFGMPYSLDPMIMKGTAQPGMTFGQMFAAPPTAGGFGYTEVTASANMTGLTGIGFNGKLGLAYKMTDRLSLGVNYTLPTSLTYKNGAASMDMTQQLNDAFGKAVQGYLMQHPGATPQAAQGAVMTQFGQMGIDLSKGVVAGYDLNVDLKFPQSVGVGASYKASENLLVSMDVEWLNWAAAFDHMTIVLSKGTNANINTMLGNNGAFNLEFPMDWKNSVIVKVGGEYTASEALTLRLGYAYGSNPVPQSTIFPAFPAIVEHHLTAGGSYQVSGPLTLHAAIESVLNNSLTAASPSLIANEYDGSKSSLATTIVHVALSYAL